MALEAVEGAYAQKSRGEGGLWPMVFHGFDPGKADLDIKSGELGRTGYFGFKLVSWFGANPDKGCRRSSARRCSLTLPPARRARF